MVDSGDNGMVLADELIGWFLRELPYKNWLKDNYVKWDDDGVMAHLNIDFNVLYRKYLGTDYNNVLEKEPVSFYEIGSLILLTWQTLLKEEFKDAFADEINLKLKYFEAPLRLNAQGYFYEVTPYTTDYADALNYKKSSRDIIIVFLLLTTAVVVMLFFFKLYKVLL